MSVVKIEPKHPLNGKNDGEKSKAILTKSHYHNRMSSDKESIKCIHAQEALPSDIRIEEKKRRIRRKRERKRIKQQKKEKGEEEEKKVVEGKEQNFTSFHFILF